MFLRISNQCSVLPIIFHQYHCSRLFHISDKNYIRKIASKSSASYSNDDYYKKNIDPSQIQQNTNKNFFGIESDEGVIIIDPAKSSDNVHASKCSYDVGEKLKEKFHRTSFGVIRRDSDNKLSAHGQYENIDYVFPHKSTEYSSVSGKRNELNYDIFDVLYNKSNDNHKLHYSELSSEECLSDNSHIKTVVNHETPQKNIDRTECSIEQQDMSYIDECIFGSLAEKNNCNKSNIETEYAKEELSYLDKIIFENNDTNSLQNSVESKNVEFLTDEDILKEDLYNIRDTNISNMSDMKHFIEKEINFEKYPKNSSHIRSPTDINFTKNKGKKETVVSTKQFEIEDFHKLEADSFKDSVPEHLSNKNVAENDFASEKKNVVFYENPRNEFKLFNNSKPNEVTYKSDSKVSDEDVILPKGDKPSKFQRNYTNKNISDESSDVDNITTAHEFVSKLRNESKIESQAVRKVSTKPATEVKLDSKGFRILKNQVPDMSKFTREEIIAILKNNVIYLDDNLLILNKPYSLILHDSQTTHYPCLSQFLDDLAKDIDCKIPDPKLHTVHRLDKETTGCLLLARNECMAGNLKSLFAQRKIIKKYWIVTSRMPDPPEGVIDIPISEGSIDNKKRMVLHPHIPKDIPYKNHSKSGKRAVTSYKVLSVSGSAALVEVTPETGIKHQIRVHFGFGLSCPILGDHKYSHLEKMAPQKLPSDLLQKLHVRQSKVRHIPMHIHAYSITIPGYFDGRDLYVSAPLPRHMTINMKKLKFKKKNKFIL